MDKRILSIILLGIVMLLQMPMADAARYTGMATYTAEAGQSVEDMEKKAILAAKENALEQTAALLERLTKENITKSGEEVFFKGQLIAFISNETKLVSDSVKKEYSLADKDSGKLVLKLEATFDLDEEALINYVASQRQTHDNWHESYRYYDLAMKNREDSHTPEKTQAERVEMRKQRIAYLEKAIELNDIYSEAYVELAREYMSFDDDKAIQLLSKAIEIDPENDDIYDFMGLILSSQPASREKLVESVQYYTKAIELNPHNGSAYSGRAYSYSELENYDKAIQDYSAAINLAPSNSEDICSLYGARGNVYEQLKKYDMAIADYNNAIHVPYSENNWYGLGTDYYEHSIAYMYETLCKCYINVVADNVSDEASKNIARKYTEINFNNLLPKIDALEQKETSGLTKQERVELGAAYYFLYLSNMQNNHLALARQYIDPFVDLSYIKKMDFAEKSIHELQSEYYHLYRDNDILNYDINNLIAGFLRIDMEWRVRFMAKYGE